MLNNFWHWFVVIITVATILGCWWLLRWTKGVSNRKEGETRSTGHTWDGDLEELNNPLPRWWLILFYATIVFALAYLVVYPGLGNFPGLFGWSQENQYAEEMQVARQHQQEIFAKYMQLDDDALIANKQAVATGRRLFANHCAMCHGSDARGARGFPNLADDDWLYGGSFDTVMQTIANGRSGVMPPMGAGMSEHEIDELVAYVRSLSGQQVNAELAASGKEHFQMLCSPCHGPDGGGNQAIGAPRLNDSIWLYGGDPATIAETIRKGRNGKMPAHKDSLSPERRRLIAAYVLSLSAGDKKP
jgi:cytochrome c oxidase cbb3-type subunit 3